MRLSDWAFSSNEAMALYVLHPELDMQHLVRCSNLATGVQSYVKTFFNICNIGS